MNRVKAGAVALTASARLTGAKKSIDVPHKLMHALKPPAIRIRRKLIGEADTVATDDLASFVQNLAVAMLSNALPIKT